MSEENGLLGVRQPSDSRRETTVTKPPGCFRVSVGKWSRRVPRPKRTRVYKRDGYRCVQCLSTEGLTLDHRIPLSRGGTNALDNLQTMCADCNKRKADRMPDIARDYESNTERLGP